MLKRLVLILIVVSLFSCKDEMHTAIDNYLEEHLNDPDGYENIEIENPKRITHITKYLEESVSNINSGSKNSEALSSEALDSVIGYYKQRGIDPYEILGYEVRHKFRAKNSFGALVIQEQTYIFSKDLKKILRVR